MIARSPSGVGVMPLLPRVKSRTPHSSSACLRTRLTFWKEVQSASAAFRLEPFSAMARSTSKFSSCKKNSPLFLHVFLGVRKCLSPEQCRRKPETKPFPLVSIIVSISVRVNKKWTLSEKRR